MWTYPRLWQNLYACEIIASMNGSRSSLSRIWSSCGVEGLWWANWCLFLLYKFQQCTCLQSFAYLLYKLQCSCPYLSCASFDTYVMSGAETWEQIWPTCLKFFVHQWRYRMVRTIADLQVERYWCSEVARKKETKKHCIRLVGRKCAHIIGLAKISTDADLHQCFRRYGLFKGWFVSYTLCPDSHGGSMLLGALIVCS